jgi:LysM repeat protein
VDSVPLSKNDSVRIVPGIDQLSATLLNSEEIEIKAQVNLAISIFTKREASVIVDMKVEPIDYTRKAAMPGIVGYVAASGDTIWSIARKYYTTTESIREINHLENDIIKEGDRLIIVKS